MPFRYDPGPCRRGARQPRGPVVDRNGRILHGCRVDIVFIRSLEVSAVIGIYAWERQIRQKLIIDLEMGTDIQRAAASDDITDTLNYKAVAKRIAAYAEASEFNLVETLAERIAGLIQAEFAVPWLRLTLNKTGAVRGARDVGVIIERGQR